MSNSIPPKKSLGQNFLTDESVCERIVDAADVGPQDSVLEIGPGHGVLTRRLAACAGHVTAIELDERLFGKLSRELAHHENLEIIQGDALKFPYEDLPGKVKVVANLPYYISTPIISRLIEARKKVSLMVLMLQKEVAERIAAPPGGKDYGYLSVMVQLYTEAESLFVVPAEAFDPVPKVDSAVARLIVRGAPVAYCRDFALFERVVSASFSQRRKTLKNSLKGSGLFTDEGVARLADSGIDPIRRAETLSVAEFAALTEFLFEFRKVA
ncbi:MAG: ribosomal RNA small subunit methyltransferase A [Nitrospirae bacterium]|nr:ribosomal RNA small subunit methyltransferase A [Nitrospirota bacterium]